MSRSERMALGSAGEARVEAALLERGWNPCVMQVDYGADVWAVRPGGGETARFQVKTAEAESHGYGYSGQFAVEAGRWEEAEGPGWTFVFLVRRGSGWGPVLVLGQGELREMVVEEGMGSETGGTRVFYVRYHLEGDEVVSVKCSDSELVGHVGWEQRLHTIQWMIAKGLLHLWNRSVLATLKAAGISAKW